MKKFFLLLVPALLAVSCSTSRAPQDKLTVNDKKIDQLIAQMTLEEKVNMLHSKTNMSSAGVERLGIADMHYADGPSASVRKASRTASSPRAGNSTPPPTSRPAAPSRPPGPGRWLTCMAPAWARKPASAART